MARCSSNVSDETNSSGVDPWDLGSFLPKQGRAMEHAQKRERRPSSAIRARTDAEWSLAMVEHEAESLDVKMRPMRCEASRRTSQRPPPRWQPNRRCASSSMEH